jgi:serine-type D-Ala-D-Ala carboxypeptidase/endopeptidase (penicillin-binding protein 4)
VQRDGSGLSRYNYLSAEVISRLLRGMDRSRVREEWHRSLPVMGSDGTLSGRGHNSPITGRVWAKTGSISNTRTLSGYLVTSGGDTLTFALLTNNFTDPNRSVEYVQDLICERLVTGSVGSRPPPPGPVP